MTNKLQTVGYVEAEILRDCILGAAGEKIRAHEFHFSKVLDIYRTVDRLPYIKKAFVGSGIRYDLISEEYMREVILRHVSGRLKVAPEHTESSVLRLMRKPDFALFEQFNRFFDKVNREAGLNQQLIPYFISSHPGCTTEDMASLAFKTKRMYS